LLPIEAVMTVLLATDAIKLALHLCHYNLVGGVVAEWLARSTRVRKDTGSNPAGAGHYVTTVGKLFTPTVPSRAEGRLNQLAPGTAVPL